MGVDKICLQAENTTENNSDGTKDVMVKSPRHFDESENHDKSPVTERNVRAQSHEAANEMEETISQIFSKALSMSQDMIAKETCSPSATRSSSLSREGQKGANSRSSTGPELSKSPDRMTRELRSPSVTRSSATREVQKASSRSLVGSDLNSAQDRPVRELRSPSITRSASASHEIQKSTGSRSSVGRDAGVESPKTRRKSSMVKNSDEEVILSQSEQVNVQISEADKKEVPDKSSCKQIKTELNGNVANEPKIFI